MAGEARRGCGYRVVGGTYLVGGTDGLACGRLPVPLVPCPRCRHRAAFTRGLQRTTTAAVLHSAPRCRRAGACGGCPVAGDGTEATAGLLWVGDRYYTPETFTAEARALGPSKRIPWPAPRWLEVGRTWVLLAHEKAIVTGCAPCAGTGQIMPESPAPGRLFPEPAACEPCGGLGRTFAPGIFSAFVPLRVERIIPDTMPEAEREALRAQGLTPVAVPADDPDHRPRRGREE